MGINLKVKNYKSPHVNWCTNSHLNFSMQTELTYTGVRILDSLITRFRMIKRSEQFHCKNTATWFSLVLCPTKRDSIATISASGHNYSQLYIFVHGSYKCICQNAQNKHNAIF